LGTNEQEMKQVLQPIREFFARGETREVAYRRYQLKTLRQAIKENEEKILIALYFDLGKPSFEAFLSEIVLVLQEINYALKNLSAWANPSKVKTPLFLLPGRSYLYPEPYGIVLIMGPWNYPFQLLFAPLVGAIASGNCVVLKTSGSAPHTSALIKDLIKDYFDPAFITVVEGGSEVNQQLLKEKFDYIFFTGSIRVGKIVMKAAAENLTPVTLELGGKNPCIVDKDANLNLAASKIAWGKFINAGQTCVAPDYLYVHSDIKQEFMETLLQAIRKFYGDEPQKHSDYGRIINQGHFDRLADLLPQDPQNKDPQNKVYFGGHSQREDLYIQPTVLDEVTWSDPVMEEEIFGPILPVLTFDNLHEVIAGIRKFSKPLALYLFTKNKKSQKRIWREVPFGGGCVNNVIMHLLSPHLPFGGVGKSGMGTYHGRATFDTFTHYKSTLHSSTYLDMQSLSYPPYQSKRISWWKKLY